MKRMFLNATLAGMLVLAMSVTGSAIVINEWVSNDISTDDYEFIELCGDPLESLDGYTVILIEGESSKGNIDRVIDLTGYVMPADGYFVIGDPNVLPDLAMSTGFIENGGNTIVLVSGFTQALNVDVDVDDDCVEEISVGIVLDAVSYGYGYAAADCITYYGAFVVGPDGTYDPAGGARCEDCTGGWEMLCMDGTEPTGPGCGFPYTGIFATPGAPNDCTQATGAEPSSWGSTKALFR